MNVMHFNSLSAMTPAEFILGNIRLNGIDNLHPRPIYKLRRQWSVSFSHHGKTWCN
jgi:hypothetical protein